MYIQTDIHTPLSLSHNLSTYPCMYHLLTCPTFLLPSLPGMLQYVRDQMDKDTHTTQEAQSAPSEGEMDEKMKVGTVEDSTTSTSL